MKMNKMETRIAEAAIAYYAGDPIMTDEEFDALTDQLDSDHWMRTTAGWGGSELASKLEGKVEVAHRYIVGGLPKSKYDNEVCDSYEVTHKLDGITGVVYYDDEGNLENVVTRGDGTTGIRVDADLNLPSKFIPKAIVRGEIVIMYNDWLKLQAREDLARTYKHPRNAAAGIVNSTSRELDIYLTFIAFDHVTSNALTLTDRLDELDLLSGGFRTVDVFYGHDEEMYDNTSVFEGSTLPWKRVAGEHAVVDGSVWREIGGGSHAFKYANVAALTTVTRVEWIPTVRGRLAPTVHFNPVDLDGATISKASGKSAEFIVSNNIGLGTIIEVIRANNVIPDIVNIVSSTTADLPTGESYYREGANFRLTDARTSDAGMIDVSRSMILDKSRKGIARKAIDQYVILAPELEDCTMNDEEKDGKTFRSVEQAIAVAQATKWTYYELLRFCEIDGIGDRAAVSFLEGTATDRVRELVLNSELYTRVIETYLPELMYPKGYVPASEDTGQEKVCITGSLDGYTKATFASRYDLRLVDVKDADVVIASDLNSAKAKRAAKLGKKIMTQAQFEEGR